MEEVVTLGNPHVGVILRGQSQRPEGAEIGDIILEEVGTAQEKLDGEFGKGRVPIVFDLSHDHAKYEGGGEAGQLAVAAALGRLMARGLKLSGWMGETYVLAGKQREDETVPGMSITDPCIGQEKAENLILQLANQWRAVRAQVVHV
jgi:phospho-2-dehydro-3-deoxyheptonate aldolase